METYKLRLSQIEKETIERQNKKIKSKQEAERKLVEVKEKLTTEIINYGLWQSKAQANSYLEGMQSETQKRAAVKAQLRFRKTVLQQEAPDSLYRFSSKEKGQFNSQQLHNNLVKLIEDAEGKNSPVSSLTGKAIKHQFEESNGKHKQYKGRVISQVPGFPDWFNVVYTNEPEVVYTYKLSEDLERGDLQVL